MDQESYAHEQDQNDELKEFRNEFIFPDGCQNYLCGNSLGLMSQLSKNYVIGEMNKWGKEGVEGHFKNTALGPWVTIDEICVDSMAKIVGAQPVEVTLMNSLTANLHFLMVSFYRPTSTRFKILIEEKAFPSDHIAVESQILEKGFNPKDALLTVRPRDGEELIRTEDIISMIEANADSLAMVLFAGIQYYTGQAFEMEKIARAVHDATNNECSVGFDLAHAVGNIELNLHDWNVDFAAWCSYKYLNSGPGGIGGAFVHSKHHHSPIPRFCGWWGHRKTDRFLMNNQFCPSEGAFAWQLSNPCVLALASLKGSLDLFDRAGMKRLREKSVRLTNYLEYLLTTQLPPGECKIITPGADRVDERGAQLSLVFARPVKQMHSYLESKGIICDMREPNVIRIAPAPMYNSFIDVYQFVTTLNMYYNTTN